jgi:hypothetical protein
LSSMRGPAGSSERRRVLGYIECTLRRGRIELGEMELG